MDFMFSYFWVINISVTVLFVYLAYKAIKTKKLVSIYSLLLIPLVLFMFYSPVKMDLNTKTQTTYANTKVEQNKVLPPKVSDDSFEKRTYIEGITKSDME